MMQPIDDITEDGIIQRWDMGDQCGTLTARGRFPFADHVAVFVEIAFVEDLQTLLLENCLRVELLILSIDLRLLLFGETMLVVELRSIADEQSVPFAPHLRRDQTSERMNDQRSHAQKR